MQRSLGQPQHSNIPYAGAAMAPALGAELRRGQVLATRALIVAYAALAVWCAFAHPWPDNLLCVGLVSFALGLGAAYLELIEVGHLGPWHDTAFVALNAALLVSIMFFPTAESAPTPAPTLAFLLVLPTWAAFGLAARPIISSAAICLFIWAAGVSLQIFSARNVLDLGDLAAEAVAFATVAGMLATLATRTRRMAVEEARLARTRANLARYLSPNLVETLSTRDAPMGPARRLEAAVLFVDIVGFTRRAESLAPEAAMKLLRRFHRIAAKAIFDHGGTLDKFLGDGLMATFGAPEPRANESADALACAKTLIAGVAAWNAASPWREPIHIGIGLHFGPVVVGDLGDSRRLDFTVVGDVVNVASRLQGLTRRLNVTAAVSDTVVARAGAPTWLKHYGPTKLPGRSAAVDVWVG